MPDRTALNERLRRIDGEIAASVRRTSRAALWRAAAGYRRSRPMLCDLLPAALLERALRDPMDPTLTWQVLRHLCRHIRFNRRSPLGSSVRLRRCRTIAAGEVALRAAQKLHAARQATAGALLRQIGGLADARSR